MADILEHNNQTRCSRSLRSSLDFPFIKYLLDELVETISHTSHTPWMWFSDRRKSVVTINTSVLVKADVNRESGNLISSDIIITS